MSDNKGGQDDGVVTSAPASSVGSLLTDLLSEARKDVAAERQQLESKLHQRETAEREARAREEARKREAMQAKLIEETRLRNQAISTASAKKGRAGGGRKDLMTAPHTRPKPRPEAAPAKAAPKAAQPNAGGRGKAPLLLLVATVLIGIGVGFGGAFALTPKTKLVMPDVDAAARAVVEQTAKAAQVEGRMSEALTRASSRISQLEKEAATTRAAQDQLKADLDALKAQLEAKDKALAEATKKSPRRGGARPGGKRGGSGLNINTGVFKD